MEPAQLAPVRLLPLCCAWEAWQWGWLGVGAGNCLLMPAHLLTSVLLALVRVDELGEW